MKCMRQTPISACRLGRVLMLVVLVNVKIPSTANGVEVVLVIMKSGENIAKK